MEYQDSNSERRNLVAISMAFIIYHLAGGEITNGGQLKLQAINVTFHNPEYLTLIAWIILFWFLLRYWQTSREIISNSFAHERGQLVKNKFMQNFLLHQAATEIRKKFDLPKTRTIKTIPMANQHYVNFRCIVEFNDNKGIKNSAQHTLNIETNKYARTMINTHIALTRPAFTSTVMPYILFFLAVALNSPWEKLV
ncbi:hypothetical protein [Thiomicrorhabdus sediminis]|uniref:Uncharacterized protein n=1 Tax=Thiomicrorhabdus sediminis TaxID=2580412 RepID=A0A4P9K750_9GAMM|nr:hypothetical protein [Thiomicrorhabdus sediminis]QCU90721.1 hypothetical protein FE785_08810 [Thiomicrorhabdus sediminis]